MKCKLPTNCFRAKLYTVSNRILLLSSGPHTVRLLVKSNILKLSGSPQNLFQQIYVTISMRVYFGWLLLWTLLIAWTKMFINQISSWQLAMWCTLRYVIYIKTILQWFILKITAGDVNPSSCWCIDTQSYGKKAVYPKHACYHGFVYNFIKDFYKYVSIDYDSTSRIETKVFVVQPADTYSVIWIFSYTYPISFTRIEWRGCIDVIQFTLCSV